MEMAEARVEQAWDHTSLLACVIANSAPFRKGRAFKPEDFRPKPQAQAKPKLRGKAMIAELRKFLKK